jgi:methylmalonyl-CoA mutase
VRFVTAAALFDGHDAAINIMRRILQSQGAEVIHLGHNRSVREVVDTVLEEDAAGVAVSSYQGGHVEYFEYLAQALEQAGAGHVRIFGGGGGVIVAEEITRLADAGVRIFSPEDGQRLGLPGMINELIRDCDVDLAADPAPVEALLAASPPTPCRRSTGCSGRRCARWPMTRSLRGPRRPMRPGSSPRPSMKLSCRQICTPCTSPRRTRGSVPTRLPR